MTTPVSGTNNPPSASDSSSSKNASKQLAGNFDTFLTLLTTQLKNQDPTSPMDSNQFTQQLVMYSQVEQQINTNDNLEKLITISQGQSNNLAMSYLNRNVVLNDGSGVLSSNAVTWNYGLDKNAANSTLTVSDSDGKVVFSQKGETLAGVHEFDWDGRDADGNPLPDGIYKLSVSATASDSSTVNTSIQGSGVLSSGSASWNYGLDNAAAATTLTIRDSSGKVVYSRKGEIAPGVHTFNWDGKDANGNRLPDGLYNLTVSATDDKGKAVTNSVASKGRVTGIDLSGSSPQLIIGTAEVPLASATLVTN
jgi:flagellar basal-body rod modification protein FlgD